MFSSRPQMAKSNTSRLSTATTVEVMSDGTPETSMIEIGLPALGMRKMRPMKSAIVSPTSMPENMNW
ncbi:hypothetical protein D3C83_77700 [compost metagenome]